VWKAMLLGKKRERSVSRGNREGAEFPEEDYSMNKKRLSAKTASGGKSTCATKGKGTVPLCRKEPPLVNSANRRKERKPDGGKKKRLNQLEVQLVLTRNPGKGRRAGVFQEKRKEYRHEGIAITLLRNRRFHLAGEQGHITPGKE